MSISKKKALPVKDPALSRVVQKIYDDINELITAINMLDISNRGDLGKTGDLRVAKRNDGEYYIEAKGEDGWYTSTSLNYRTKYKD